MIAPKSITIGGLILFKYHTLGSCGDDNQSVIPIIGKKHITPLTQYAEWAFSAQFPPEGQNLYKLSTTGRPYGQSCLPTDMKSGM